MILEGSIKLPFAFAAGRAGSAFLDAVQERHEILGSHCKACERTAVPARSFCPTCSGEDLEHRPVGPKGVLKAWTEVPDKGVFGLVLLEGAATTITHKIKAPVDNLAAGITVLACFSTAGDDGSVVELLGFNIEEIS